MLGRLRRTTRLDVGLAMAFAGLSYLVWALVAGISRWMIREMIQSTAYQGIELKGVTQAVRVFFVDFGFVIDLAGVAWLVISLVLVLQGSRQRISISWAWLSAMCQAFVAAIGAVAVGWAAYLPHVLSPDKVQAGASLGQKLSEISLPVILPIALLVWVTVLAWMLVERSRLNRRGPTLSDGMRSNVYR